MENFIAAMISILLVFLLVILPVSCVRDAKHERSLMTQCMEDHKEYECVVMFRKAENNTSYIPVPVVMPVR